MNETTKNIMKAEDTFTVDDLRALLKKAGTEKAVLANEAYLLGYHRAAQTASGYLEMILDQTRELNENEFTFANVARIIRGYVEQEAIA